MAEACGSRTHPSRREAATPTDLKSARVTGPRALPGGLWIGTPLRRRFTAPRVSCYSSRPPRGAVAQFGRAPEWHSGGRRFDPVQLHHYFLGLRPESSPASQATSSKKSSKSSASGRNSAPLMTTWTHRPVAKEPPSQPTSAAERRGHSGQSQEPLRWAERTLRHPHRGMPQRLRD